MRKLAILLTIIFVISMPLTVSAATWSLRVNPQLNISGTTATCKATVIGNNTSEHIEVTMKLMYGSSLIASWSDDGYGYVYMNKTATVTAGRTYKLVVEVNVNGVAQEPIYITKS